MDNEVKMSLPTENVELPSKGLLYPLDNPLSSGVVEMKYMTAKEEDILSNQNYLKDGTVFDKLLKSLIVSKINYDDLTVGDKNAILIADRAIGTDQGLKFVYVMDRDNKLEYRRVTVGELQPDNLRAIESGLNADEKVVVSGIHLVRPGTIIKPDLIEMPVTQF